MRKFFTIFFISILFLLSITVFFLSTTGYETKRFNNLINNKLQNIDEKISLELNEIKLKLDIKKLNFFLSTENLKINYNKTPVALQQVKIYFDLISLLEKNPRIKNLYINTKPISVKNLKKLILNIKPSNLRSLVLNDLNEGMIKINFSSNFDKNFSIQNYQIDGYVRKISGSLFKDVYITDTNFIFSINPFKGNLNEINGRINSLPITNGKLNYEKEEDIKIVSNFQTQLDITQDFIRKAFQKKNKFEKYLNNEFLFKGNLNHDLKLVFSNTYKLKSYEYDINGLVKEAYVEIKNYKSIPLFKEDLKTLLFQKTRINLNFNSTGEKIFLFDGLYSFNKIDPQKFDLSIKENNYNLNVHLLNEIDIPIINYKKKKNSKSKIEISFNLNNNLLNVKDFLYTEGDNSININNLKLDRNGNLLSFKDIKIKTSKNDFLILKNKKIIVTGKKFDASGLSKLLNSNNSGDSMIKKLSAELKISLDLVAIGLNNKIQNFNLIGEIKKGKPVKISAKGEFEKGKYLDISLKKDKNSNKKYLEVYSDFPEPLLKEYKFFKGLSGGKMLYNSVYEIDESISALTIEDFKVINAPGFVKLLSLADFGGMADLVSGKGLTFDKLEMNFSKNKSLLKLEELYAIGPSISVLMDGYVEGSTGLVSLRGTMVPAKNLNKFLSKIPVVGDILIPKEIGEGLFGVSFKMKGQQDNIKTTVNPIKTLTPRFIQKAIGK